MTHDVLPNFIYGIDSFILCAGLAPAWPRKRTWVLFASLLGLADGIASFLGYVINLKWIILSPVLSIISPALVAIYGFVVLAAAKRFPSVALRRPGVIALMLLLSLDNFVSGSIARSAASLPIEQAMTISFVTAAMALAGCFMGKLLIGYWSIPQRMLAGSAAIATALIMSLT